MHSEPQQWNPRASGLGRPSRHHFNSIPKVTAPCRDQAGLGLDGGWLLLFDRRRGQPPIAERTRVAEALSLDERRIRVIRA